MTPTELILLAGVTVTFILGVTNFFGGLPGARAGTYKAINEAIKLANERALEAEERAEALEIKNANLEARIDLLEKKLAYKIGFEVLLGPEPSIIGATIEYIGGRRVKDVPYVGENKRK